MGASAAFDVVARAIAAGPIPGAAAAVGEAGVEPALFTTGVLESEGAAVTPDTWYDLASLTKVLSTTGLLIRLIATGRVDPRAPVREVLPEAGWLQPAPNLADATVLDLASHRSGLAAWVPLYTLGHDVPTLRAHVLQTPITGTRGSVVYSDLGFITLGMLLERLLERPLDELAVDLYADLGVKDALAFSPRGEVAPTERCPWRGRVLRGEVHDENSSALGGVSGHAGLFGTLRGVAGFARALVEGSLVGPGALDFLAREHARAPDGERRGFGWSLAFEGWSGGELCGRRTIGHTGFTGTGLWIDLDRGRYTVLLTNRVHPTRHVESGIVRLRRLFNHAAFAD